MAEDDVDVSAQPPAAVGPKPVHIGGESLADRLLPHLKKIMIGAVSLAVILSAYFGYRAVKRGRQADETAKFVAVNKLAVRGIEPVTPDDPNEPKSEDQKKLEARQKAENPTYPTLTERAGSVLAELGKQDASVGHSYRAGYLLDAGKIEEAIAEYKRGTDASGIEGVLCREGLGIAHEALATKVDASPEVKKANYEAALAAYASMQPEPEGERHAYALYHQGRVLDRMGKKDEAKAMFEKAKAEAPVDPENAINRGKVQQMLEMGRLDSEQYQQLIQQFTGLPELIEQRLTALGAS